MKIEDVNKQLKKPFDDFAVDELYIYLRNDRKICNSMNRELVDFANKKIKLKEFNSTLFIQAVKLNIDKWLASDYWRINYSKYLERVPSISTRYQVAMRIAKYIECDFLGICK